jgi:hypothetical protein
MTIADAEAIFAKMMRIPSTEGRRDALRNILMRHRVAVDAGLDHKVLHSQSERRRRLAEQRARYAVHRGVGAASGRVSAPELLFGDPLPACDRWGDAFAVHLSGGSLGPLERHETLGHEQRPTLPSAAAVKYAERVGPHGLVSTQLHASALPVTSLDEVLEATVCAQFGELPIDEGMAAGSGIVLAPMTDDAGALPDDVAGRQQDGARRWPPRALRNCDTAANVAEVVEALVASVERQLPTDRGSVLSTLGTASVDMYWRMCRERFENTPDEAVLADFCALGVCAHARVRGALHVLHRQAMLVAMVARSAAALPCPGNDPVVDPDGYAKLGVALERLSVVLVRCGA